MSKEPKRNVYVGHRYVPLVIGEWEKTETYEGLSIVTNKGTSYTSKKRVPKGIDILNEEYWVVTGNYNAQIEEYRGDVSRIKKDMTDLETGLTKNMTDLETGLTKDMSSFKDEVNNEVESKSNAIRNETKETINKYHGLRIQPLELIAHRGFMHVAPENTMTAFTNAHLNGADSLECDVQITKDGKAVIIHDSTVNRTTTGTGNVDSFNLADLQKLDAGSKFGGNLFKDTKIPTFEEFLKFAKGKTKMIYPEIKGIRSLADIKIIVDLIKKYKMEHMTCIQSFTFEHLKEVRKYSTVINFGFLTNKEPSTEYYNQMENDGKCTLLGRYDLFLNDSSIVEKCYSKGIEVGTWTVDDMEKVNQLLEIGVYKIMSNLVLKGV